MIPFARPGDTYLRQREAIDGAIRRVLESGWYILGRECEAFEKEFAARFGVAHAVGVANGTEAIHLALRAHGIGPGDEVIVPSHTAVATIAAVEMSGAQPVFADIDPAFYTVDPMSVEAVVGPKTRAIIAVHLYGQPCDLEALQSIAKKRGLILLEDCAQCHLAQYGGRTTGSMGSAGCFSFYPTKNLGAFGDGGLVATQDAAIAKRLRELREYGWRERYQSAIPGFNSRLDELQAAILREKLRNLDADTAERQRLASVYLDGLASCPVVLPAIRPGSTHVFHLFVVRSAHRDALLAHLRAQNVGATIHYPSPVHMQEAYHGRLKGGDRLAETERASREILTLPLFPGLTAAEQATVVSAVRSFASR
jgi:dTDP-4-amino-4,6-dideoxygalactose transaminase